EEVSIENQIRAQSPRYKALTSTQPLTLAQVQQQVLDDGTALLEYSLGTEASYLWAVTRNTVRIFRLPARDELNTQADELRRQILPAGTGRSILELVPEDKQRGLAVRQQQDARISMSAFVNASYKLYKSILEPAIAMVDARRLLIVADDTLSFIPFEVLVTAPVESDYTALPYLVKSNETVYAPSASVVDAVRRQASASAPPPSPAILLIADPIFDVSDERAKNLTGKSAADAARGLFVT